MKIIYRVKKSYNNIDNLFKFFITNINFIQILLIIIIRVDKKLFKNIVITLFKDPYFNKIYK